MVTDSLESKVTSAWERVREREEEGEREKKGGRGYKLFFYSREVQKQLLGIHGCGS